jgi:hypothetical protein
MPPIQPSLRGTLLTSASAVALSVSASGASAQTAPATPPPTWSVWVEGALFWTGGGSFNVPSPAGIGFPGSAFKPPDGVEGAAGFDYRWAGPWHVVADVRYGRSRTATANSGIFNAVPFFTNGTTILLTTTTASSGTEKESHLVADFMVGRDLGVGSNAPELLFGIRVADLHATAHVNEFGKQTFYSSGVFPPTITTAQSASGTWSSRFFGAGPRLALTGSAPIAGFWSLDYQGGAAVLIGDRSSNFTVTTNGVFGPGVVNVFTGNTNSLAAVVNADGWAAVSYRFTPNVKVSGGIRADYYIAPLASYNFATLQNIDRLFWGPFVRLTGNF